MQVLWTMMPPRRGGGLILLGGLLWVQVWATGSDTLDVALDDLDFAAAENTSTTHTLAAWRKCQARARAGGGFETSRESRFVLNRSVIEPRARGRSVLGKRLLTREDSWTDENTLSDTYSRLKRHPSRVDPPPFVRTLTRAAKAWWVECPDSRGGTTSKAYCAMGAFIEKCASTTLRALLGDAHCGCGDSRSEVASWVAMAAGDTKCCAAGTFFVPEVTAGHVFKFAFVRDPLDRLLSSVQPHGTWRATESGVRTFNDPREVLSERTRVSVCERHHWANARGRSIESFRDAASFAGTSRAQKGLV